MKKIPTIFERDWNGDRSRVVDRTNPVAQWVFDGQGTARKKYDGTCCLVRDGVLFKRRELKNGEAEPSQFEEADFDEETGKRVGWLPVGDGPDDRWHREAFDTTHPDGTYELLGPKVQGNVEQRTRHTLQAHNLARSYWDASRTFDGLRNWLAGKDVEGIVWHHPDGRMAKIKLRDFGIKRVKAETGPAAESGLARERGV